MKKIWIDDFGAKHRIKVSSEETERILEKPYRNWTLPEQRMMSGIIQLWDMGNVYNERLYRLFERESEVESPEHRRLIKRAKAEFRIRGYGVNGRRLAVMNEPVCCDFTVWSDDGFEFVEALTPWALKQETIENKRRLARYAPLWFVIGHGEHERLDANDKYLEV